MKAASLAYDESTLIGVEKKRLLDEQFPALLSKIEHSIETAIKLGRFDTTIEYLQSEYLLERAVSELNRHGYRASYKPVTAMSYELFVYWYASKRKDKQ